MEANGRYSKWWRISSSDWINIQVTEAEREEQDEIYQDLEQRENKAFHEEAFLSIETATKFIENQEECDEMEHYFKELTRFTQKYKTTLFHRI